MYLSVVEHIIFECKRNRGYLKQGDLSFTDPIWEVVALSMDYVASAYLLYGYKKAGLPHVLLPILRAPFGKQTIIISPPLFYLSYKPTTTQTCLP